ncbi:MAG TPA: DnaA/Hda family protein, partial [Candidatus Dormibacteraeota bacterium]|nr:DnaA/Hda family protein [Candidatus Dormibacteraeota bacterium]
MGRAAEATFATFLVGDSNRAAFDAAHAVAEAPGRVHNPLVLLGRTGLGKTHLLHAIAAHVEQTQPPATRVVRHTSESFVNELVVHMQGQTQLELMARYRSAGLVTIDDVHLLAGKDRTQGELAAMVGPCVEAGGQLVLSSTVSLIRLPTLGRQLAAVAPHLLEVEIEDLTVDDRLALVRRKADDGGRPLPPEVEVFLSRFLTGGVREIEGALNHMRFTSVSGA